MWYIFRWPWVCGYWTVNNLHAQGLISRMHEARLRSLYPHGIKYVHSYVNAWASNVIILSIDLHVQAENQMVKARFSVANN